MIPPHHGGRAAPHSAARRLCAALGLGDMTTTYDPADASYFDAGDLRREMDRVFDLCHGCRLCFNLCPSFPTLFAYVDAHDGRADAMTRAEQDEVVEQCYQCKLCYAKCPYVPPHEWELDFPRMMMRAHAVSKREGSGLVEKLTDQALNRTDLVGRVSSALAPVANRLTGTPGSLARQFMERTAGISAARILPPYARERFTTWFSRRSSSATGTPSRQVSVFPTCFIEYMEPGIGRDLVRVYERNGVACSLPAGTRCCGAPWLHSGDVERFRKVARRNVQALAAEVRAGLDVIVAQPTCAYVLRKDYPIYVGTPDADLVAAHTFDPAEYLMAMHKEGALDTSFSGLGTPEVPEKVTYHLACHLRAQMIGYKSRDLLKLSGIEVDLVQACSGIDGTWGYRAANYELALQVAAPLMRRVEEAGNEVVCGDCHLANGAIYEGTGRRALHPMQLVARAYGIPEEDR